MKTLLFFIAVSFTFAASADVFKNSFCPTQKFSIDDYLGLFEPGTNKINKVGYFKTALRTRTCTRVTKCSKWEVQQKFEVECYLEERNIKQVAEGASRRKAEQSAAQKVLDKIANG